MPDNDGPPGQNIDLSAGDNQGSIEATIAGRDAAGRDIYYYYGTPTPQKQRPHDEKVLLKAVLTEVCDRLDQSIHQAVLSDYSRA